MHVFQISGWVVLGGAAVALLPGCGMLWMRQRARALGEEWTRERRVREEIEAYALLDVSTAGLVSGGMERMTAARLLARRVCQAVAEKSVFRRVALLLRDPEGRLVCVGSTGMDDLTVAALHSWADGLADEERKGNGTAGASLALRFRAAGRKSFSIALGEWSAFDAKVDHRGSRERRKARRAIVAPLGEARIPGAIVVCGEGTQGAGSIERAMGPIEALAARLGATLEHELLAARLLRVEKLAGLGQLAGGVAHALNNPLTAVIGFAELIAETTDEARVRQDAATIVSEAVKMKETVARLIEFWRPSRPALEPVNLGAMLVELEQLCTQPLAERGIVLSLQQSADTPPVSGSEERLRQVVIHLLNNAVQAIADARASRQAPPAALPYDSAPEEQHVIRITLSCDPRSVHLIISDSGPGFRDPQRIFDPFYTTKEPSEHGAGLGLSICYGIVREHGGEISAFNLHPRGAAVVIELPVRTAVEASVVFEEVTPAPLPVGGYV